MAASRYRRLPVTETGVYTNETTGRLEYWFVLCGGKTKCGECLCSMTQDVKDAWERQTTRELRDLVARKVKDGTLRVDKQAVSASLNKAGK